MFFKLYLFNIIISILFIVAEFKTISESLSHVLGYRTKVISMINTMNDWKSRIGKEVNSIPLPRYFSGEDAQFTLSRKCFRDLGCIYSDNIFDTIKTLPIVFTDPHKMDVRFNLFTRLNKHERQSFDYKTNETVIKNSLFSPLRKTKLIVHGYMASFMAGDWMDSIKNYLLNQSDDNVFAIDWTKGADSPNYFQSAADTRLVGAMTAFFINSLIDSTNASVSDFHCIGHSLGAHTCGFVGQRFKNPKLGQISGFDPACPGFESNDTDSRLDPSDADLVSVIHTNAGVYIPEDTIPIGLTGILGNPDRLGHFDFYPNGGKSQPGCGFVESALKIREEPERLLEAPTCNHGRSHVYPLYANQYQNGCQMIGYQCDTYEEFEKGLCVDCGTDNQKCKPLDFNFKYWNQFNRSMITGKQKLNYYLKTSSSKPFCLFHYQILVQMTVNNALKTMGQLEITLSGKKLFVAIPETTRYLSTFVKSGFKPKHNYTELYLDKEELIPSDVTVMWTTYFGQSVKIHKIVFKFMSHINESVRKQKSFELCPKSTGKLSKGDVLAIEPCHIFNNNSITN